MWDERYSSDEYVYGTEPNHFLKQHYSLIPQGRVLCLAEGEGRNAVFLAAKGYEVTAVDSSKVGLDKARKLADSRGVQLDLVHADLADFDLGRNQWQGIVSIFCHLPPELRRRVYEQVPAALGRDGVFLLEAYTPRQLDYATGGPPERSLLVEPDDLRDELDGLDIQRLAETEREVREGRFHTGPAAVVQAVAVNRAGARFQFSSNRGSAIHKVRYVESGGGAAEENCRVCTPKVKPR